MRTQNQMSGFSKKEYAIMLFFLSMCGNVLYSKFVPAVIAPLLAAYILVRYYHSRKWKSSVSTCQKNNIKIIVCCWIILFLFQYVTFGWNTVPGLINHISKFIVASAVIIFFNKRFRYIYFRCIYILCLVSLPLWLYQVTVGTGIPGIKCSITNSIWIYTYRWGALDRNCGFFWEPGAMGGYICLSFLLFFNNLKSFFLHYKKECVVVFVTLLTTQSTGGYISFGMIVMSYILFSMKSKIKYVLFPLALFGAMYTYSNVEFLSSKVGSQNESASELRWGEYSSTRIGSLWFDLYYINKHPLIGNGLHENTRYADHPFIWRAITEGKLAASGNGFSDQLVKWGAVYILIFCIAFFRTNRKVDFKINLSFLLLVVIIMQGEMFMNYPLFTAIPLIDIE